MLVFFVEDSVTDPTNQKMVLNTTNLCFNNLLEVEETCVYSTSQTKESSTDFEQQAAITAYPWGIARKVETWAVDTFVANASKGRAIMEDAIDRILREKVPLSISTTSLTKSLSFGIMNEKEEVSLS